MGEFAHRAHLQVNELFDAGLPRIRSGGRDGLRVDVIALDVRINVHADVVFCVFAAFAEEG